jgi:ribosomal protein S18 acetylase RimI-like enzyme
LLRGGWHRSRLSPPVATPESAESPVACVKAAGVHDYLLGLLEIASLGFRTDLMIRRLAGSTLIDRARYLVVTTPMIPGFWWGNFVLFPAPPRPGDAADWSSIFAAEFPDARHLALGLDGISGDTGEQSELDLLGVTAVVNHVLTARRLYEPAPPTRGVEFRRLMDDDDWEQAAELDLACSEGADTAAGRLFSTLRLRENRELCDRGHGAWFGAFVADRMVTSLGLLTDGCGVARYQSVQTHPDHRRRGLASRLAYEASRYGLREWATQTLVIVADPEQDAIGIYRSLGFVDAERQVQLQREPATSYSSPG